MITRWICEKDNKKWIYPIEKCIYCKGPIKKIKSTKTKIIGITKVNIPSPLHPIIPYNIILLEDEHGNRMPKKTMKDYKIGEAYGQKKAKTDGAVAITKIKYDIKEALAESLDLLKDMPIKENDKVVIKPCIIEPAYAYQAVATNPKLIDALISYLKEKNIKDIIVAEQAIFSNETIDAAQKCGIIDVCKKHEVPFVDLSKSEFIEKNMDDFAFRIAKEFFERKVINVPVMKTNSQLGVSGAMENMVRAADKETQKRLYDGDIEKTLPRLIKILPEFLTIGDATIGMHGNGPTFLGEPAFLNMLFLSKDPVAVDAVFSEMGMFEMPYYLKEACAIGAGNNDTKSIEIVGDELDAIRFHLKAPERFASAHPKINLIDGKADPYTFLSALKITGKLVGILGYDANLVIGNRISKESVGYKNRLVAYGNEAIRKLREFDIKPIAEINDGMDDLEKVMLLKSVLENPDKRGITATDKIKSKLVKFGAKIKSSF